ncbi:MAG: acetate--CoA ligase family protein [Polyangiaceae bacterium]|nr:acetate--CoA ligase family protein [Polyangiaceae bacterium]
MIGASRRRGTIAGEIFHNLLANDFAGAVYPVNPTAAVVQSVKAYPTVGDIPDEVDLALLVVPRDKVLAAVEECGQKGVRALVVISAGFGETGAEGRALQDAITRKVRGYGMRMVGPNCLGILNTAEDVRLDATFAPTWPPAGNVAFSSQSGALGLAILDYARDLGIGVRQFVSMGNKADVSGNDLVSYWGADPTVKVILLYLESLGNPRRFMDLSRKVSRVKPIVVVKSGRTEAGARAASSHTGALAGLDVAVDALLGQAGVIRTDTIEELFDMAMLLGNQPVPKGSRVAILTNAGGPGIMASDACESRGLSLPRLSPKTEQALLEFLPPEASVKNPVDMIASAPASSYERALGLLLADEQIDAVLVLFVPPIVTEPAAVATAIRQGAAGAEKPVLTCFMGTHGVPEALSSLREGRFPSYAFPEAAAIALSRAVSYGRWLARPAGEVPELADVTPERAQPVLKDVSDEGRWLDASEVNELLGAYGIAMPATRFATTMREAGEAAEAIGFPVALKLMSREITHKSDVSGVVLGLLRREAVEDAFAGLRMRLAEQGLDSKMDGVVVQAMAQRGLETFVGVTHDAQFGPLIGFGMGGVSVEVWKDVVFRVPPLTDLDAREMLDGIRGSCLLDGFRGEPPADREALVDTLLRISRLVADVPEILELDINPLIALPPGSGVLAVDARIRIAKSEPSPSRR